MTTPDSTSTEAEQACRRRGRRWLRVSACCLLAYAAWCTALYFFQDRLLFRTDLLPALRSDQMAWGDRAVRVQLDLDGGGQVEGWFLPAPQAGPQHPAPLAVFFHGNAERIEQQSWFVRKYHEMGCSVLLPEYRGYGRSAGKPSEAGIVADSVRFYDQIVQRSDVDRLRVVFHGRSLGGGVAAQVAARRQPAALILECTFTSVAVMAHKYFAPMMLASNSFRTDEVLPALDIPVFIAHGTRDTVVPVGHGRRLRGLARNVTYVEYKCGHNDLPPPAQEGEHWRMIASFLENAGVLDRPGGS